MGLYDDSTVYMDNAKIENVKYIKDSGNGDKFLSDNGKYYSIDNNMILSTRYMYDNEWTVTGNYERLLNTDGSGFFRTNSNTVKMIPNANNKPKILNTTRLTSQIKVNFLMKSQEYSYIVNTLGLDHAIFKIKLINAKTDEMVYSDTIYPEDFKAWVELEKKWVNIFDGKWHKMSALLYMSGLEGYENDLYLEFEPIITDTNYTIDISDIQVTPISIDEDTIQSGGNISEMLERTYRYADETITNTINDEVNQSNWTETDTTKFSYIKNKPSLSTVATSGNYNDLSNKPNLSTVATSGNYNDLSNKPTTLSGYGITDAYTKDEIDSSCIKLVNGYVEDKILLSNVSLEFRNPNAPDSYYWMYGNNLGLTFGRSDTRLKKFLQFSYEGTIMTAETDIGVMLYNKTKLTFGLSSNENEHFEALKLSSVVLAEAELRIGDSRIPSKFSSAVKMPRLNILNNSDVYEGALWNSTYNRTVHDGLHLTHEPSKYLILGYKDETDGIYYSYMIMDEYRVLDDGGVDWCPIRFEKEALFRQGLKIGAFSDIKIGGYNLTEKISSLENAITTGTGMVQWSNVLSKPTTISGYGITDALSKTGGVLTGALQILSNDLDGKYNGLLVGNDCYIGDCNYTDTIGIMGVTNNNVGYIKFGKLGGQLGFNGTNLVYNGTNVSLYGHTHLYDETLAFVNTPSGTTGASWGYDVPSYNTAIINKGTCMSVLNSKLVFTSPTTGVFQLQGTVVISASGVSFYYYVDGTLTGQLYKSSGNTEVASFNTTVKLNAGQKVTFFFGSGVASTVTLDQLVVKRLNY